MDSERLRSVWIPWPNRSRIHSKGYLAKHTSDTTTTTYYFFALESDPQPLPFHLALLTVMQHHDKPYDFPPPIAGDYGIYEILKMHLVSSLAQI
jgi:hypothetical protein